MPEDLSGHGQTGAHQHCGPDHGVKPCDVLPDHVQIGRPPLLHHRGIGAVPDRAEVVDQRIDPHVDHARRIVGHGNAPRLPGTADRNILEAAFNQSQNLVGPDVGNEKLRTPFEVIAKPLGVFGQSEEIVLLSNPLWLRPMNRTQAVNEILLLLEGLARLAVPAFVIALEDVARRRHPAHELLNARLVARLCRADEIVEGNVQTLPDIEELQGHAIAIRERILAELARLAEHVLRVLVVAHHEMGLDAAEPLVPRDHVGGDLLVRRPQMRPTVHVVDRGRQIETNP